MSDNIKHPSHYAEGRNYEPKDVIRDWGLNFNLGSAVKYISRAGRKDDIVQDLKKAQQFIRFEIDAIESERGIKPKVECAQRDNAISLSALMDMSEKDFFHAIEGKTPFYIIVDGEDFVLTEIEVSNRYPTMDIYCKNDDFELEIRSKR